MLYNILLFFEEKPNKIIIYPNPVKGLVFIEGNSSILTASVMNLNGQILIRKIVKERINISQLKNGVYFLELCNEKDKSTHKLIVMK